ncbi:MULTISPECIES: type II toxin-antitoxin system VapC family toxin [unclassified Novosphingobium]|uniref:type II toxin-antitoxin system VapC family toxin n=1 Tax=unclassified Novosphingobium TaxID=2644732 RepID=UPI0025F8EB3C|nr:MULTISPECIES: type II toxin-antitoxin system VapC family toxin [unclassified Novosphingobium]HQV03078.1 type II toxin-antitoxin system VapC family toxin [Novosphingobium sp.]
MKYLLDSNIIIYLTTNTNRSVVLRAAECDEGDLVTSAIAFAEVIYGSRNAKPPPFEQLQAFVEEVPILDFDYKAALAYATLPFKRAGYYRLIAAHALSHGLTVVTHNEQHFADVPGLAVENWTV